MHQVVGTVSAKGRSGFKFALIVLVGVVAMAMTIVPASAVSVAFLVMPKAIGTINTMSTGSTVSITLTAQNSSHVPVAGGTVFISFIQAPGGGTAFVGSTGLLSRVQAFTSDASGHVVMTYSTPVTFPSPGPSGDLIHAQNASTAALSTAKANAGFSFSPIVSIALQGSPIARKGSLSPNQQVPVTLTAFGPNGARLANGSVQVEFHRDQAGSVPGGSASINGVALGPVAAPFTLNASGQLLIIYTAPSSLPTIGVDRLIGSDAEKFGPISTTDHYQFTD